MNLEYIYFKYKKKIKLKLLLKHILFSFIFLPQLF
jgi:hypothetical protein